MKKGYNDVPRPQSQPIRPESLIESKEALVLPCLHHSVQCSFVQRASWQNSLVHHAGPDYVYRIGGQCPRQATCETRAVNTPTHGTRLTDLTRHMSCRSTAVVNRLTWNVSKLCLPWGRSEGGASLLCHKREVLPRRQWLLSALWEWHPEEKEEENTSNWNTVAVQ